eukprot:jgi/Chlat1/1703/Chrsp127S01935
MAFVLLAAANGFQLVRNAGRRLVVANAGWLQHKATCPSSASTSFNSSFSRNSSCCSTLASHRSVPIVYHAAYSAPKFPARHRFPILVFQRIYETLLAENIIHPSQVHVPDSFPTNEELRLAHCAQYLEQFMKGSLSEAALRRIGLPWSEVLVERTLAEVGVTKEMFKVAGTMLTAELAIERGLACNTAGGTHHAFRDYGSGFCIINDLAVTALSLLHRRRVERVLIVDLDVHQGDGTAALLANEPRVFTMSVHCESNFPAKKQVSDLDIALSDGVGDEEYLRVVAEHLPSILSTFRPSLVLYDAGVDPHIEDVLGRLCLSDDGLYQRELLVLDLCLDAGVPVAGNVGGGYHTNVDVLAKRHCLLHRAAAKLHAEYML